MTFQELRRRWETNTNAEYIVPTLERFNEDNIIISKELPLVIVVQQLKVATDKYEKQLNNIKVKD